MPIVNITNISKTKVSDETGMDKCNVTFEVNENFHEYKLNINGVSYDTGTNIEHGQRTVEWIATNETVESLAQNYTVESMARFISPITVEIDDSELINEGTNRINIYAKNTSNVWSLYE